jgi:hypothetical protein
VFIYKWHRKKTRFLTWCVGAKVISTQSLRARQAASQDFKSWIVVGGMGTWLLVGPPK